MNSSQAATRQLQNRDVLRERKPRPVFELYDLKKDPHELNNLAASPAYKEFETRMR